MRYLILIVLCIVCGASFAQDDRTDLSGAKIDSATSDLNARTFYLQNGVTPGDMKAMTPSQRHVVYNQAICNQIHSQIDEQIAMETSGHVGFYNFQSLRQAERADCPQQYPYRAGISPGDPVRSHGG